QSERDALLKQIESLKKSGANGGGKADEQLMMKAALTNVKGPGVSVLIEDSLKPVQSGENPNLYVIHDEDILRIVNELH
ncbi:Division initiation protein, partial [human gut metagenome]